jgi:hypothetical protein
MDRVLLSVRLHICETPAIGERLRLIALAGGRRTSALGHPARPSARCLDTIGLKVTRPRATASTRTVLSDTLHDVQNLVQAI